MIKQASSRLFVIAGVLAAGADSGVESARHRARRLSIRAAMYNGGFFDLDQSAFGSQSGMPC
jgi:hypothetical protein